MSQQNQFQFKYPPAQSLCIKHRLATRIWKGISQDQYNKSQKCPCCGKTVGEINVDKQCCYDSTQLSFLGVGIPLFFTFAKCAIILLIILSLVFCVFGLWTNIIGTNCRDSSSKCKTNIFNTLSIVNKINSQDYLSIQNYILLAFVVLTIFVFQYFRYKLRKVQEECDEFNDTPSDYAIIIKRLPQNVTLRDIQEMVQQRRGFLSQEEKQETQNLKVIKIVLSYDLTQFTKAKHQNLTLFKKLIKQDSGAYKDFRVPNLPVPKQTASIAIVIFQRQQSKKMFIYRSSFIQRSIHFFFGPCSPLSDFYVQQKRVSIQRAPQPDDIVWQNASVSICSGVCRKMSLGFLSFILLLAGGAAQYGLALVQNQIEDETYKTLMGTASSIVVSITNVIIQQFLILTVKWERMNTVTQYMDVLTLKMCFLQFLNAGIFVVGANILASYQNFTLESGLSYEITQIMALNAVTSTVGLFVFYHFDIKGKIFRYALKKGWIIMTQLQANIIYQLPAPQVPYKYAYIMKTIWLTAFYASFVPIVVPLSIIGLILYYLTQKKLYNGSYSSPNMISSIVNDSCFELFEYVPLILCLGQFLVYFYFYNFHFNQVPLNWSVPIFVSIGISIVNLFVPMGLINKRFFKMNFDVSNEPSYNSVQKDFQVTYQMTNPVQNTHRKRLTDVHIWKQLFGTSGIVQQLSQKQSYKYVDSSGFDTSRSNSGNNNAPLLMYSEQYIYRPVQNNNKYQQNSNMYTSALNEEDKIKMQIGRQFGQMFQNNSKKY